MDVFRGIGEAAGRIKAAALALGNFDGVHRGHQALLAEAIRRARDRDATAAAFTFDPHPGKVLAPELAPPLICAPARKLELLAAAGLDAAIVQPFDRAYAARPADAFLAEDLFGGLGARDLVVGPDFTYGRDRAGTVESLRLQCSERGVGLAVIRPVTIKGLVVSSTKVRELVLEGRMAAAARLLGRPFDLAGAVERGVGRGRTIGFPTANLVPEGELRPGMGVYAVRAHLPGGSVQGGAANIGRKPTFGGGPVTVEVHLFDCNAVLYGSRMAVEFLDQLRPERRFPSPQALSEQIARDVEQARQIVAAAPPPGPLRPRV